MPVDEGFVSDLNNKWQGIVDSGKVFYDEKLLKTRRLEKKGKPQFFLVYNSGRQRYLPKSGSAACPFCSAPMTEMVLSVVGSLAVVPNQYPCLPFQYLLISNSHTGKLESQFIVDAFEFERKTGFKVYYNGMGSGGSIVHFHFQTSPKETSFPAGVKRKTIFDNGKVKIEELDYQIFSFKLSGQVTRISDAITALSKAYTHPINLVIIDCAMYLFPRTSVEIPPKLGDWKFGSLEMIGTFIFRDEKLFGEITYESLLSAQKSVSLADVTEQKAFKDSLIELISGGGHDG